MIADANVLLRILDPRPRNSRSRGAGSSRDRAHREPIEVLAPTVLEIAFVLESSAAGYGWDRVAVAAAVDAIVDEPGFAVEHGEALRAAAATYRVRRSTCTTVISTRLPASAACGCSRSTATWCGWARASGHSFNTARCA